MKHRLLKGLLGLMVVLVIGAIGVYVAAKPYQRDRIRVTLQQHLHSTRN